MNDMKYCQNCGKPMPASAPACPECGHPNATYTPQYNYQQPSMSPAPKNNNKLMIIIIALLAVLVIAIVAAIIIFSSSSKEETSTQEPVIVTDTIHTTVPVEPVVQQTPEVVAETAPAPKRSSSPYDYTLKGSIGQYKIEMEISSNYGDITGRYRYNRMNGKGGWLSLRGNVKAGDFYMEEYTSGGKNTGTFSGTLEISGSRIRMYGTMWTDAGKEYSFNASGSSTH